MAAGKIGANKPTGTLLAYAGGSRINTDRFLKRAVKVQGSLGFGDVPCQEIYWILVSES